MANVTAELAGVRGAAVGTYQNPMKYLNQDYEKLRAQSLASGKPFEDPTFPAAQASLGYENLDTEEEGLRKTIEKVVWKRPADIQKDSKFIKGGAEQADLQQGSLNKSSFLSSIAPLTQNQELLNRVLPAKQNLDKKDNPGIFQFSISQFGEWVDVVVDDLLPTSDNKLVFANSTTATDKNSTTATDKNSTTATDKNSTTATDKNSTTATDKNSTTATDTNSTTATDFRIPLLEKAYAKVKGSYKALDSVSPVEALEDFTGGVTESNLSENPPDNFFQIICDALRAKSLVICITKLKPPVTATNVVGTHAYSVTGAEKVSHGGAMAHIVRVRDPSGSQKWNGDWSDKAPEWDGVTQDVRNKLLHDLHTGETWMSFRSFLAHFTQIDICHLNVDGALCSDKDKWSLIAFHGKWREGVTAGGRKDNLRFWTNPHFRITLKNSNEGNSGNRCYTVLVSLMQKACGKKKMEGGNFKIGFYIYKFVKDDRLGEKFFKENEEVASLASCKDFREVSKRFTLPAGDYVIIPTTQNPDEEADFLLRVISQNTAHAVGSVLH